MSCFAESSLEVVEKNSTKMKVDENTIEGKKPNMDQAVLISPKVEDKMFLQDYKVLHSSMIALHVGVCTYLLFVHRADLYWKLGLFLILGSFIWLRISMNCLRKRLRIVEKKRAAVVRVSGIIARVSSMCLWTNFVIKTVHPCILGLLVCLLSCGASFSLALKLAKDNSLEVNIDFALSLLCGIPPTVFHMNLGLSALLVLLEPHVTAIWGSAILITAVVIVLIAHHHVPCRG